MVFILSVSLTCASNLAFSAEYGAEATLASSYTDNLTLSTSGATQSQWVNVVIPRLYLTQVAPQYAIDVDYSLQGVFYAGESELNEAFSQLWTTGLFNLIGDELFLRGYAKATQVNIEPDAQQPDNNLNITGNRSDAFIWEVGPQWRQSLFGGSSLVDAHYFIGHINYDREDIQSSDLQDAEFLLRSDPTTIRTVTYELRYRFRELDYEISGPVKIQDVRGELGYFLTPSLQAVGIGGGESNLAANDGKIDEPYWEAGFRGFFGVNTVEAFYGRRFYGPSYRFSFSRSMPSSSLRVNYRERQQTDELGALDDLANDVNQGLDPAEDISLTPDSSIDRPGSGNRAVNKRLTADYRARFYRTNVQLAAYWREREELASVSGPSIGLPGTNTDESYGAGIDLNWAVGSKTSLTVYGGWTNRTFSTQQPGGGSSSDVVRGDVRVRYNLGRYTEVNALIGFQSQSGAAEFDEGHAAVSVKRYFGVRRGARNTTMPTI